MPSVVPIASSWTSPVEMVAGVSARARRQDQRDTDQAHHDVVDDRSPHRRGEATAGVQDRARERADPVEEDLRQEEVGEDQRQVVGSGARHAVPVDRGDGHGRRGRDDRHAAERQHAQGEHPLVVGLAAVVALPRSLDQQRHDHAGQDPAEGQVVDRVRHRVGDVVSVAKVLGADRIEQHGGADKPRRARGDGADGHDAAGPGHAGRPGRRRIVLGERR